MTPERGSTRAVSILGHPVTGLAPISFLSAGWIILALQVVPRLWVQAAQTAIPGGWPFPPDSWPPAPRLVLLGIVALALLLAGFVLFLIWARSAGGLGPLTDRILVRAELLAAVMLLVAGVLSVAVVSRGVPSLGDAESHIGRGWLWQEYVRAKTFPRWTDLWFGGLPAGQHAAPLAHLLQGLIGFLRFDPPTAAKVLAWFCRMAGGTGFALLCARIHRDHRSGLLGGVLYTLAPTIHGVWIWEGSLPHVVLLAILPWALFTGDRLATGVGRFRSGARFALAIGLMTMAHAGEARLAFALTGALMLVRALPTIAKPGARAPSIPGLLIALLGGGALAAAFVVPLIRDAHLLNYTLPENLAGFTFHPIDPAAITATFRWSGPEKPYLGLSVAILALGGFLRSLIDRREGGEGIGPIPIAVLILVPWFLIPISSANAAIMFVGIQLAAAGFVRRSPNPRSRWVPRKGLLPIALLLVLVDLAPFNLSTAYGEGRVGCEHAYARLEDRLASGRFLELSIDSRGRIDPRYDRFAPSRAVASVGGPSLAAAPRNFSFQSTVVDTVARALAAGDSLSPDIVELLAFHNVRYLLLSSPAGPARPRGATGRGLAFDAEIPALGIERASPVALLDPGLPPAPIQIAAVVSDRGLPPDVSRELAREQLEWIRAARPRLVGDARAVALPNRLEIEVPDLGSVMIRIARNVYPATEVLVDGRTWPWEAGPLGGIVLMLEKGPHKIEVWGRETPLRRTIRIAQWVLAGLLFLVAIGPHRR